MGAPELYKQIVRHLPNGAIWVFDLDLRYIAAGGELFKRIGLEPAQVIGKTLFEVWGPEQTKVSEPICRAALAGESTVVEEPFDGHVYWVATHPLRDDAGSIVGGIVLTQDITKQRTTEVLGAERRRDLYLKDEALNAALNGIVIVDALAPNQPIVYTNKGFTGITGYEASEVLGRNCRFLQGPETDPDARARIREAMAAEKAVVVVLRNYRKDGTPFWNELSISPVQFHNRATHYIGIQHDITQLVEAEMARKRLDEALAATQKVEALGLLAGGMAHEFNNILTAIINYTKLIENAPGRSLDYAKRIQETGWRGAAIVRQLLAFARKSSPSDISVSIRDLLQDLLDLIHELFPRSIKLESRLRISDEAIQGDRSLLTQVFVNLALNARDAMPDGGLLHISAAIVPDSELPEKFLPASPEYALIVVSDTGCGIPEACIARIFEPFFTTKRVGEGTGLGLSVVAGVVANHQGFLDVQSKEGRGTTFRIWLPLATAQSALQEKQAPVAREALPSSILLVDDEESIRTTVQEYLNYRGYTILTASDGFEALRVFEERAASIQLVVTDLSMPNMDGAELTAELLSRDPELRILICSGHIHSEELARARQEDARVRTLLKPYHFADLEAAIQQLLAPGRAE